MIYDVAKIEIAEVCNHVITMLSGLTRSMTKFLTIQMRLLFLFLLLSMGTVSGEEPHHTTAYIGAPGETDLLLTYSTYSTDHFWNKHGKKLPTYNHFKRQSYLLYAEYAFNNCNSFTFHGGYSAVQETLNGNSRAVEDIELGWKHLICTNEASALTAQLIAIVPVGDTKSSVRYGKWGAQAGLLYSNMFCLLSRSGWYDLELGYRWYQDFPSDRVIASAAVGYDITSRIQVIATGKCDYGINNGHADGNLNNIAFHGNYRLFKAKIECVARLFSHVSVSVGAFKHFWGRNVGAGGGFYCGTWIDF